MDELENVNLTPFGMGIDQHAVLFKSSTKVYRAIKPKYTDFYNRVLQNPVIQNLMEQKILINTACSEIKITGYDLVLEHPLLPVVSYPFEWTPSMFQDACAIMLKLNIELLKIGYCTYDAHLWNVIFDGTQPVFVDFTSIIQTPENDQWLSKHQFNDFCLNPLLMMEAGYPTSTRYMLREIFNYPEPLFVNKVLSNVFSPVELGRVIYKLIKKYLFSNLSTDTKINIRKILGATKDISSKLSDVRQTEIDATIKLLRKVESLSLRPDNAQWSEYYAGNNELPVYDGNRNTLDNLKNSTPKHQAICSILHKIKPKSVLDIGCNRGLYSQIAGIDGARVIGIDMDERALDDMYLDAKQLKTNTIPLYVNAVAPAEAIGFKEIPFPSAVERLRSELVMCLAVVHHLVFKRTNMSFGHIAKLLDSYSERFLLVEFVPREDMHVQLWYTGDYGWYTLENFESALSHYFSKIEIFESFPNPRVILFCEKAESKI